MNHNLQPSCSSMVALLWKAGLIQGVPAVSWLESASAWKCVNDEAETAEFRTALRTRLAVPGGTHVTLTCLSLRTQRISCPRLSMSGSTPKYLTRESRQLRRGREPPIVSRS